MNRKEFLKVTGFAAAGTAVATSQAFAKSGDESQQEIYEFCTYTLKPDAPKRRFDDYLQKVLIPALNDKGISPVGVFTGRFGGDRNTIFTLTPYKSIEQFASISSQNLVSHEILKDKLGYTESIDDPLWLNVESTLMKAFSNFPKIKLSEMSQKKEDRLFEMRMYQSPTKQKNLKKIEMFNTGGEIDIFNKVGFRPLFFGEMLAGTDMPNLTYMLAFKNLAELDELWGKFGSNPDWRALSGKPEYADLLTNIKSIILRPKGYSQI